MKEEKHRYRNGKNHQNHANVSPPASPNSPKPLSTNGKRKFLLDPKRITKKEY
jgi:hypothetical protein